MNIIIVNKTKQPIYDQISSQIKAAIQRGEIKPGDYIPSMRALAKELRVGVVTVQKAYENLQKEGVIFTTVGKGTFVTDNYKEMIMEEEMRQLNYQVKKAVQTALDNQVSLQKLMDIVKTHYGGIDKHE